MTRRARGVGGADAAGAPRGGVGVVRVAGGRLRGSRRAGVCPHRRVGGTDGFCRAGCVGSSLAPNPGGGEGNEGPSTGLAASNAQTGGRAGGCHQADEPWCLRLVGKKADHLQADHPAV